MLFSSLLILIVYLITLYIDIKKLIADNNKTEIIKFFNSFEIEEYWPIEAKVKIKRDMAVPNIPNVTLKYSFSK